jgi:hypothetical protein
MSGIGGGLNGGGGNGGGVPGGHGGLGGGGGGQGGGLGDPFSPRPTSTLSPSQTTMIGFLGHATSTATAAASAGSVVPSEADKTRARINSIVAGVFISLVIILLIPTVFIFKRRQKWRREHRASIGAIEESEKVLEGPVELMKEGIRRTVAAFNGWESGSRNRLTGIPATFKVKTRDSYWRQLDDRPLPSTPAFFSGRSTRIFTGDQNPRNSMASAYSQWDESKSRIQPPDLAEHPGHLSGQFDYTRLERDRALYNLQTTTPLKEYLWDSTTTLLPPPRVHADGVYYSRNNYNRRNSEVSTFTRARPVSELSTFSHYSHGRRERGRNIYHLSVAQPDLLEFAEDDPFQTPGASPMWELQPPRGYKGKIRPGMGVQKRMTPRRGTFESLGYEIDYNVRDAERMRSLSETSYKLRMMEWKEMRDRNSI